MSRNQLPIDDKAADGLSVAPPDPREDGDTPAASASGERRNEEREGDDDAALDTGVEDSMDASDPPSATQPRGGSDPAPSSGYHEERERQQDA